MAPKAAASGAQPHVAMKDMIKQAIMDLKERNGSSRQALKKYIQANNTTGGQFDSQFNRALKAGAEKGDFIQPKGASGPVKLNKAVKPKAPAKAPKKEEKPATEKKAPAKATTTKKPAAKKATASTAASSSKASAPKKAATKPAAKPAASKAKKPAAEKPKAEKGTKSGRVTKSTASTEKKPAAKKQAAKAVAKKA